MPLLRLLLNPLIVVGTAALAAAQMAGDKMTTAPNRIVPVGLAVHSITADYAGPAVASRGQRVLGGAIVVGDALAASYVGWWLRGDGALLPDGNG